MQKELKCYKEVFFTKPADSLAYRYVKIYRAKCLPIVIVLFITLCFDLFSFKIAKNCKAFSL